MGHLSGPKILGPTIWVHDSWTMNTGKSIFGLMDFKFPDLNKWPAYESLWFGGTSSFYCTAFFRFGSSFWSVRPAKYHRTNPNRTVLKVRPRNWISIIEKYFNSATELCHFNSYRKILCLPKSFNHWFRPWAGRTLKSSSWSAYDKQTVKY